MNHNQKWALGIGLGAALFLCLSTGGNLPFSLSIPTNIELRNRTGIFDTRVEGNFFPEALLLLGVITALSMFLLRSKDAPAKNGDNTPPLPDPQRSNRPTTEN